MTKAQEFKIEAPRCPACTRIIRLVRRERQSIFTMAEVLTFKCECGQIVTSTADQ